VKILLGIGHPADPYIFKHFIDEMQKRGHEIFVAAREKEITYYLLDKFDIPFQRISSHQKTISGKVYDYFLRWSRTYRMCHKIKPDIAVGVGDFYLAQIGRLQKFPSIVITDTEQVRHDPILTFPFASHVLIPSCYHKETRKKFIRFYGYHELFYLHETRFTPDQDVLKMLGIDENEKYMIMRFVSRTAAHDIGHQGMSMEMKIKAVEEFSKHARVFISSEHELPDELKQYQFPAPPEKMHDALYYAEMLYGESSTMASECACLGTPAIFIDDDGRGYTDEQEKKYGLVYNFSESAADQERSIQKGIELLETPGIKNEWKQKSKKMLAEKIDMTAFLVWFVEQYPESAEVMIQNPDYQLRFKPEKIIRQDRQDEQDKNR